MQAPAQAIVEMQQCLAQSLSISYRKPQGKPADAATLLLQLPHFDHDVVKKLKRNKIGTLKGKRPIADTIRLPHHCGMDSQVAAHRTHTRCIFHLCAWLGGVHVVRAELGDLPVEEQRDQLSKAGLAAAAVEEVVTFLSVMPTVHVLAKFEMEGEDEIVEQDVAKCKVNHISGHLSCQCCWTWTQTNITMSCHACCAYLRQQ